MENYFNHYFYIILTNVNIEFMKRKILNVSV